MHKKSLPTSEADAGRTEGSWDLRTHYKTCINRFLFVSDRTFYIRLASLNAKNLIYRAP